MPTYAHIQDGIIVNLIEADAAFADAHPQEDMVDITNVEPSPSFNWTTPDNGQTFHPPAVDMEALNETTILNNMRRTLAQAEGAVQNWSSLAATQKDAIQKNTVANVARIIRHILGQFDNPGV